MSCTTITRQGSPLLLLALALLSTFGCATSEWSKQMQYIPWTPNSPIPPQVPDRMVAIWTETTLNSAGKTSTRGFGGRVYFYNAKDEPILVDGQLVVYAYNDTSGPDQQSAERKFIFPRDKLATHASPSMLGHSYSFWLPWDAVGGDSRQISLLPVFLPHGGTVVMGEQSRMNLPGKNTAQAEKLPPVHTPAAAAPAAAPNAPAQPVAQATFLSSDPGMEEAIDMTTTVTSERPAAMRTTTFNLPPNVGRRWVEEMPIGGVAPSAANAANFAPNSGWNLTPPPASNQPAANGASVSPNPTMHYPNAPTATTAQPAVTPSSRFARPRFQVPRERVALPTSGHVPSAPFPSAQPPVPPPQPVWYPAPGAASPGL